MNGIKVYKYTESNLQVKQTVRNIKTIPADSPIHDDAVRFVCVSDTHNRTDRLQVPDGDVLLHAGDFTMTGQMHEIEHFNTWLGKYYYLGIYTQTDLFKNRFIIAQLLK